jgi:hypothetical protein
MPATLLERMVAVLMLGASVTLLVLVVREVREDGQTPAAAQESDAAPTQTTSLPASPAPGSTEPDTAASEDSEGATRTNTTAKPETTQLLLTATAETWLDARAGSAQGRVLYVGVLFPGQFLDLRAQRIWVRFGSASNLAAELNGEPLALRPGTYTALISPSGLEISLVKQTTGRVSGARRLTLPIATTAGNALVAAIAVQAGSSVSVRRVADSTGATWRKGAVGFLTGSDTRSELWYRVASSAVTSVTVTLSASNTVAANVSEWSGVATGAALDAAGGAGNASSTTAATPSIATTQPGDLVIGAVNYPGSATSTLSAGGLAPLKSFSASSNVNGRAAYRIASAAGSYRATWTLSAAAASGGTAIALKPALPRHTR